MILRRKDGSADPRDFLGKSERVFEFHWASDKTMYDVQKRETDRDRGRERERDGLRRKEGVH